MYGNIRMIQYMNDRELIFLISQPGNGFTFLQTVLDKKSGSYTYLELSIMLYSIVFIANLSSSVIMI